MVSLAGECEDKEEWHCNIGPINYDDISNHPKGETKMFRRILIANRGEVVSRIIRTCNRMGIETVVVTSSADRDLAYLSEATEVAEIGGVRSYLDMDAIIDAAKRTRCAAIHPGGVF